MARGVTVLVRLTDSGKRAGLEVNTGTKTWHKFESGNASHVFTTKNGSIVLTGDNGSSPPTELRKAGGRAGLLYNFDASRVSTGDEGQGLSDEAGDGFTWRVDRIVET